MTEGDFLCPKSTQKVKGSRMTFAVIIGFPSLSLLVLVIAISILFRYSSFTIRKGEHGNVRENKKPLCADSGKPARKGAGEADADR